MRSALLFAVVLLVALAYGDHVHCPVCGEHVHDDSNRVEVGLDASQTVLACSAGHAQLIYDNPVLFALNRQVPPNHQEPSSFTPVNASVVHCPFDQAEDAVKEHILQFLHGQALYSGPNEDDYRSLFDQAKLRATFKLVVEPLKHIHCPVCGKKVHNLTTNYIDVNGGVQKLHACSEGHAKELFYHPLEYLLRDYPLKVNQPVRDWTNVNDTTCAFCAMQAVKEHALEFTNGQMLYACTMDMDPNNHYADLYDEVKLRERFQLVVDMTDTHVHCPVCGRPVDDELNYVGVKGGKQKIRTCSMRHAKMLFDAPFNYTARKAPLPLVTPKAGFTTLEGTECPFCTMPAVLERDLPFKHGQALYACEEDPHYANLYNEATLKPTLEMKVSYCGDGVLSTEREDCEPPNSPCCDEYCRFHRPGVMCQESTDACKSNAVCTGTSDVCPALANKEDGTPCWRSKWTKTSIYQCVAGACTETSRTPQAA